MKVSDLLHQVDSGDVALPEFQRGYVWNNDQVRGLFTSLYRGYPVGGFMTWNTPADTASARGGVSTDGTVKLLLDGQQRVTSLYGVIRGEAPKFFEGNAKAFTGLYFNVEDELFEFYAPVKMKNDPAWIDVSALFKDGPGAFFPAMMTLAAGDAQRQGELFNRLMAVANIDKRDFHIEEVVGPGMTIDVVVDIFNRVNSGGTKLSKGDLALAKVCASWPEARQEFNAVLASWRDAGYWFKLDWLLRVVNGVVTGNAPFTALASVPVADVRDGLKLAKKYVSGWLDVISGRLGLDHDRVLFSKYALVVLARFAHLNGGRLPDAATQSRLLAWYVHTGMWGRYAGSSESALAQDLEAVDRDGVDGLFGTLRQSRGDLTVRASDFGGNSMGSRFYPTLYLLTRTCSARDFGTGVPLSSSLLGHNTSLDVHHIFPKAQLYAAGYSRGEVNAVANFCFLTKHTNINISATPPAVYMPQVEAAFPGALESQWIPNDRDLWEIGAFREFLTARRELLAESMNAFLRELEMGRGVDHELARGSAVSLANNERDGEDADLAALVAWMESEGYAAPDLDVEIVDDASGQVVCNADALWPSGLQEGIGSPVVLERDEPDAVDQLKVLGYDVFSSVTALREFVSRRS